MGQHSYFSLHVTGVTEEDLQSLLETVLVDEETYSQWIRDDFPDVNDGFGYLNDFYDEVAVDLLSDGSAFGTSSDAGEFMEKLSRRFPQGFFELVVDEESGGGGTERFRLLARNGQIAIQHPTLVWPDRPLWWPIRSILE